MLALSIDGTLCALVAPFLITLGLALWAEYYSGSPVSLNLYKCSVAGVFFAFAVVVEQQDFDFDFDLSPTTTISEWVAALLASVIGIILGDLCWLQALKLLGARRLALVDAVKPFVAAGVGRLMTPESEPTDVLRFGGGLVLSSVGLALAGTAGSTSASASNSSTNTTNTESFSLPGLFLGLFNAVMDVFANGLVKKYVNRWTPLQVNGVRFGFAAVVLGIVCAGREVWEITSDKGNKDGGENMVSSGEGAIVGPAVVNIVVLQPDVVHGEEPPVPTVIETEGETGAKLKPWWRIPPFRSRKARHAVILASFLATFLAPVLATYGLFRLPLSVMVTISATGPLYAIPIVYFVHKETVKIQGYIGAVLTILGVGVLVSGAG